MMQPLLADDGHDVNWAMLPGAMQNAGTPPPEDAPETKPPRPWQPFVKFAEPVEKQLTPPHCANIVAGDGRAQLKRLLTSTTLPPIAMQPDVKLEST